MRRRRNLKPVRDGVPPLLRILKRKVKSELAPELRRVINESTDEQTVAEAKKLLSKSRNWQKKECRKHWRLMKAGDPEWKAIALETRRKGRDIITEYNLGIGVGNQITY